MSQKYVPPHMRNKVQNPAPMPNKTQPMPIQPPNIPLERQIGIASSPPISSKWRDVVGVETQKPKTEFVGASKFEELIKRPVYEDKYDDEEFEEESKSEGPANVQDDGWTTVEKKVRVKRDKVQEALDNDDAPLSDEEEEQSYWDEQPEEYETYWDRKP